MKIVIDDKIPYIREAIAQITPHTEYVTGSDIGREHLLDADALIVRTRTRCDEQLLRGTRVRFVATATIGYDHIDTDYMRRAGITWMNCPGCNAGSVAQYLHSSLILLLRDGIISPSSTIGIVGYGHVGTKVKTAAEQLGLKTMICDPPLEVIQRATTRIAPTSGDHEGTSLQPIATLAALCDVITFHVPLTRTGDYPTYHMADASFFRMLRRRPVIINTSRGAVVDNNALLEALDSRMIHQTIIDTWENEPDISLPLLRKAYIATPHIAGYSADGKVNADNMVVDGLCRFFGVPRPPLITPPEPVLNSHRGKVVSALDLYDPMIDTRNLKAAPAAFEQLRGNYPIRRETI